jgi:hypothetical protein
LLISIVNDGMEDVQQDIRNFEFFSGDGSKW